MKEKRTYDNYKEHSNDMSYENEVRIENKMFLANTKMRAKIIESLIAHAEGHIKKHKAHKVKYIGNGSKKEMWAAASDFGQKIYNNREFKY